MTDAFTRSCTGLLLALLLTPAAVAQFPEGYDNGWLIDERVVEITLDDLDPKELTEAARETRERERRILDTTVCKAITYISDTLKVRGYLVTPKGGADLPCVIFNRGGNREFGALDDRKAALVLGRIAAQGYVVVASQYRGNGGGEGREEFGGAEVADVLNLIPLLEQLNQADASRIAMLGVSRGGMMTYLALTRTDRIAAAIVIGGVADAGALLEHRPEMEQVFAELVPDWATTRDAAIESRSAVRWAERMETQTPILLMHGGADRRVDPGQALAMASALHAAGHPFRLVVLEGGDHGISEHRGEVNRLIDDWLDRYVCAKDASRRMQPKDH